MMNIRNQHAKAFMSVSDETLTRFASILLKLKKEGMSAEEARTFIQRQAAEAKAKGDQPFAQTMMLDPK